MNADIPTLREELQRLKYQEGIEYTKARQVGDRVGLSSKEVGQAFRELEKDGDIEAWGYSGATSWRILL